MPHAVPWPGSARRAAPTSLRSRSKAKSPACDFCGHPGLQTKRATRSHGKGAALLVIEGITVHSCPSCGESYLAPDTFHEIERIRALRKAVSVVRPVAVATFAWGGLARRVQRTRSPLTPGVTRLQAQSA